MRYVSDALPSLYVRGVEFFQDNIIIDGTCAFHSFWCAILIAVFIPLWFLLLSSSSHWKNPRPKVVTVEVVVKQAGTVWSLSPPCKQHQSGTSHIDGQRCMSLVVYVWWQFSCSTCCEHITTFVHILFSHILLTYCLKAVHVCLLTVCRPQPPLHRSSCAPSTHLCRRRNALFRRNS